MLSDYPPCFSTDKQYMEWKVLAFRSNLKSFQICVDCTPAYQAEMMAVKRCQSPDVDVKVLHQREMEEAMKQEVTEGKINSMSDYWLDMVNQLSKNKNEK